MKKCLGNQVNVWMNRVLVILAVGMIIYCTLYGRKAVGNRMVELRPLYSLVNAKNQPEFYRTLIMNILLFLPFGLTFPFTLPQKVKNKVGVTIGVATVISTMIEFVQFCFCLGLCETDDVIMNTLGAAFGAVSYVIQDSWIKV
jgi:glycopeptide antibiotics resistance protein